MSGEKEELPATPETRAAMAQVFADMESDEPTPSDAAEVPDEQQRVTDEAEAAPRRPERQAQPDLRPPADWRPEARAEWAKLPRRVQEEAVRLHLETKKTLQDSAQARKDAAAFAEVTRQHEPMLRAVGLTPHQAFAEVLGMLAQLQSGSMEQRAQLLGTLLKTYIGTDEAALNALASAYHGGAPAVAGAAAPAQIAPQQAQAMAVREAVDAQQRRDALADWNAFEATRPHFLDQVRGEMAAIIAVKQRQEGTRRLTVYDFKEAYESACKINRTVAPILAQREAAEKARQRAADRPRRLAAASGLRHEPAGPTGDAAEGKARNTREEMSRQFARANGRV